MRITKQMKVADIFEKYPQTAAVFREFGFGALENPILRKTFGRVTTVERGCRMHGVALDPFLDALNQALQRPFAPEGKNGPAAPCGCRGRDEAARDPAVESLLRTKIDKLVKEHPVTRRVFVKYFGEGCFSCPAFGQEDVTFACSMHNTNPELFARDCLELMAAPRDPAEPRVS